MDGEESSSQVPRLASTLILLRTDEWGQALVYLLRRSPQSRFMPNLYVFPGGTVHPLDRDPSIWQDHLDQDPEEALRRLSEGLLPEDAIGHVICAIRETFEEAGVLMCENVLPCQVWRGRRGAFHHSARWFRDMILDEGLRLSVSALAPFAHWVTPIIQQMRFDTRFFIALHPEGQVCSPDPVETVDGKWTKPKEALLGNHRGILPLSPPTLVTLWEIMRLEEEGGLGSLLERRSWGEVRLPRTVRTRWGPLLLMPWDPEYHETRSPSPKSKPSEVDPLEPFSRLMYREGIWIPVKT